MTDCGSQNLISLAMVMLSFVSFLHLMVKNSLGQRCTHMLSKVLVVGTSRTLSLLSVRRILSPSTIVNSGTVVTKQTRKLFVSRNANCPTMPTSMLSRTLQILLTKVKSSYTSLVRRSLIRSWQQCNPNLKMSNLLIPSISGRVLTSN